MSEAWEVGCVKGAFDCRKIVFVLVSIENVSSSCDVHCLYKVLEREIVERWCLGLKSL